MIDHDRRRRIRDLQRFALAENHGMTVDEFDAAVVAVATGRGFDLPPQAAALIASGASPLCAFAPGEPEVIDVHAALAASGGVFHFNALPSN